MGGPMNKLRTGKKIYKLGRTAWQRWHLARSMVTQLVEHERIKTTATKAKFIRPMIEKLIAIARRGNTEVNRRRIQGTLTTNFTRKKLMLEIAGRFKDKPSGFTRIKHIGNRKGDCAPMSYIEIVGNEIEKYEQALEKQQKEASGVPEYPVWGKKIFEQERDFFVQKLADAEAELQRKTMENDALVLEGKLTKEEAARRKAVDGQIIQFFQKKIQRVDHDLWIMNKNKYDLQKYATFA